MIFRINPLYPVVWRDPTSLQIGIDEPIATLVEVGHFEQRAMGALTRGVSRGGLEVIARECRVGGQRIDQLLVAVGKALEPSPHTPSPVVTVFIDGAGPTCDLLRMLLETAGFAVMLPFGDKAQSQPGPSGAQFAVIISHFVTEPARHRHWLRRDIPHLPIVFGDQNVTIGPFVEPGEGPCLHCADRHRTDRDAAWPAIASQLMTVASHAETAQSSWGAAVVAAQAIWQRANYHDYSLTASCLRLNMRSGRIIRQARTPHSQCGCRSLEEIVKPRAA